MQAKSTGQLSMFTYAFNSLGCIARMYTSHAEGGGFAMIRGFALGAVSEACKSDDHKAARVGRLLVY